MIDRITDMRTRSALAAAWMFINLSALAQPGSTPPAASASLPALPPQVHPNAALYPDYYALAQSHTALVDDPQFRSLRLRIAGHQVRGRPVSGSLTRGFTEDIRGIARELFELLRPSLAAPRFP